LPPVLRSRHTIPLLIVTLLIGGGTVAAVLLIDWVPPLAAEQADRVHTLLWFVVWASVVIFVLVVVVLVYAAIRFRVPESDDEDGPPTHGHTKLEVVWTVVPVILLAVMAVWAYLVLSDNEALAQDRLVVDVTAEQFAWTFTYPDAGVASGDLRLPEGRQVELRMRSKDVIHDFYVPEFYVKQDVVPGITTRLIVDPTKTGSFQVICAELCGVGHGVMRARAIVMEPGEYDSWLANAQREVARQSQPNQPEQAGQDRSSGTETAVDAGEAPAQDSQPAEPPDQP
jgi:cytochrome c oxidase subunit 2